MAFNLYYNACKILIICFLSSFVLCLDKPVIHSITVINRILSSDDNASAVCLYVGGANFGIAPKIRLSLDNNDVDEECVDNRIFDNEFTILWSNDTSMVMCYESEEPLPSDQLVLCILKSESALGDDNVYDRPKWLNLGSNARFRTRGFGGSEHNLQQPSEQT